MYSLSTVILFAAFALGIGVVTGVLAIRRFGSEKDLKQRLEEAEQQYRDYQAEVTEHFEETSRRVNNLTRSYRDVHEYLASSAMKLTNPQVSQAITQAAQQHLPSAISDLEKSAMDAEEDVNVTAFDADVSSTNTTIEKEPESLREKAPVEDSSLNVSLEEYQPSIEEIENHHQTEEPEK